MTLDTGIRSQRVAKNSFVLLVRMLMLMFINLYAVRVLLIGLGAEDYGVFNAVTGVVASLSFLTSVLSLGTQRFYSFLAGKGDVERQKQVFSASLLISVCFSVIVLILFCSLAVWFINNYMDIPACRLEAANCIAWFSLFVFIGGLLQIPFTAAIISNEDMGWYAGISSIEVVLRLIVAILIGMAPIDRLVFYGGGLLVVAVIVLCAYVSVGMSKYAECSFVRLTDKKIFRQLLSFSGWVMYGTLANVGLIQGSVILLNVFFGPIVNASFAIATQIYNALLSLANSVMVAIRPTMNKLYAEGLYATLMKTFYMSNKLLYAAIACVSIPLFYEMGYILNIWLDVTDTTTILFCRLMIVYFVVIVMNSPITIMIHSAGELRQYHLSVETIALLSVPVTLGLFFFGKPSFMVFVSMIVLAIIAHVARLICLKRCYSDFSYSNYIVNFCFRSLVITVIAAVMVMCIRFIMDASFLRLFINAVVSVVIISALTYVIAMERRERQIITDMILAKILHKS